MCLNLVYLAFKEWKEIENENIANERFAQSISWVYLSYFLKSLYYNAEKQINMGLLGLHAFALGLKCGV